MLHVINDIMKLPENLQRCSALSAPLPSSASSTVPSSFANLLSSTLYHSTLRCKGTCPSALFAGAWYLWRRSPSLARTGGSLSPAAAASHSLLLTLSLPSRASRQVSSMPLLSLFSSLSVSSEVQKSVRLSQEEEKEEEEEEEEEKKKDKIQDVILESSFEMTTSTEG